VPAKVVADDRGVHFHKWCPEHGRTEDFIRSDVNDYLQTQRYVKPAWIPREFAGNAKAPCPEGCGYCDHHEQHLCMPIVEITSRCDMACPACLVDAGEPWDMGLDQFRHMLDLLIAAERQIDVLNLSGGEPLVHPEILGIVDEALSREQIVRVSISTNGLSLLSRPDLLGALRERNVVVALQFDGFDDRAYRILRGRPLLNQKLDILDRLGAEHIATSLIVTAAGGVNDDQFPRLLEYLFDRSHIVSMMVQPLAFVGRGTKLTGQSGRLTIPDITRLLGEAGNGRVSASDFAPLPCSHPLCFSLAYYLVLDDGSATPLNRLVDATTMMDTLANRGLFGLDADDQDKLRDMVYQLWSGPAGSAPDGDAVMCTVRGILDDLAAEPFDPRRAFDVAQQRVKSIFIHAFQDAGTFDLARVRRCCNAYPQPDGTLVPACVHNVLGRRTPIHKQDQPTDDTDSRQH